MARDAVAKNWTVTGRKAFSPVLEKRGKKPLRAILGSPPENQRGGTQSS